MKITLLGTGGPKPDIERYGPSVLLQIGSDYLLFDTGRGVVLQLARVGIMPESLHSIFVTHHHFDHISNLDDVVMSGWNNERKTGPAIFGPQGTGEIVETLLNKVYANDIETRLAEGSKGVKSWEDIRQTVQVKDVEPGLVFQTNGWRVYANYVEHMHGLGVSPKKWKCLGYRVEAKGKVIAISGDAVDCDGLQRLASGADVLVLCCYLARAEINDPESERLARYTLACAPQVGKIAFRAGVSKLVLTHFRKKSEALMRSIESDVRQDYAGDIILGEDLLSIDV